MTINYTTLLGLAKPVTGTESGAWGDVVNDQITSLVEDAIANAVSISVSAGNVTLSDNDGSTDQARMAILLITGSPGTSRNIVAPSRSKWYIVRNGSDSSVVVKGSATTGVTIAAGKSALVFWNGSDFEVLVSTDQSSVLQAVYPVGSIYINATNSTNPGTLLGFGTWVAFGAGRVPVGFNASDPLFDTAEETGGSKDAVVVSHTHTYTSTQVAGPAASPIKYVSTDILNYYDTGVSTSPAVNFSIDSTGVSGTNANIQPYITVYMWKRTA